MRTVLSLMALPVLLVACGPARTTDADLTAERGLRSELSPEVELHVHGYLAGGINASRILSVANTASLDTLDHFIGLDARAAHAIVEARDIAPLATLEQLDALYYVGQSAFSDLFDHSIAFDLPLDAGCPTGVIRDRAGNLYGDLDEAVALAGDNGHITLCAGTHGSYNAGYYRTQGLSVQAIGPAVVRGYFNLADATYEVIGVRFEGVGSGINAFDTALEIRHAAFDDDTHLFATESDGFFEDIAFDGADELQLENGTYTVMDGSFDDMAPRTEGYSPIYVSYAEVTFVDSQFRGNPNGAVFLADGANVLFWDGMFGQGANANPDGDIVIDGVVLDRVGYVDGYRCIAGVGCRLE